MPDYALGPHTASLGLAFYARQRAAARAIANGMFVGQHGSWNRKPRSGYKVDLRAVRRRQAVRRADRRADRLPRAPTATRTGRPVGVAVDRRGALLVADDVGNSIWRVTGAASAAIRA